ncbi:MAG: hypothetical protein M3541_14620, partial [Acidobacteriota bacterium]|nr:hypothetical protein [Acidobacteriota bacterium]
VMLVALSELVSLPATFYRSYTLERRYELSTQSRAEWVRDHLKGVALTLAFALVAAHVVYTLIAWSPTFWWLAAAVTGAGAALILTKVAPVLLLPLFYKFKPLDRADLTSRLVDLS